MSINLKCCNLIGAATIVAARTSEVRVSHQTHRLRNGPGGARLILGNAYSMYGWTPHYY